MKEPTSYRVLKYWKKVPLDLSFPATYDVVPETKVRSDGMSDMMFDAIVEAVKKTDCQWVLYTINKSLIEKKPSDE